jgi:flagellar hook-length control protein FliK
LARQVRVLDRNGETRMTLRLSPPSLGEVTVEVSRSEGAVHVRVAAGQSATREWIESNLPQLRQSLANEGVNLGSINVGSQSGGQGSGAFHHWFDAQDLPPPNSAASGEIMPPTEPAVRERTSKHHGALDVSA